MPWFSRSGHTITTAGEIILQLGWPTDYGSIRSEPALFGKVSGGSHLKTYENYMLTAAHIAITPMIFFIIFAAQEEIYETWFGWLSRLIIIFRKQRGDHWRNDHYVSQYGARLRLNP